MFRASSSPKSSFSTLVALSLNTGFNSFYETYFLKTWRNLHELYLESCTLDSQAIKELTNFEFPNLLVLDLGKCLPMKRTTQ